MSRELRFKNHKTLIVNEAAATRRSQSHAHTGIEAPRIEISTGSPIE